MVEESQKGSSGLDLEGRLPSWLLCILSVSSFSLFPPMLRLFCSPQNSYADVLNPKYVRM